MEVASGLAGGTLMTVAGQTMLAVAGQSMSDAPNIIIIGAGASGIAMAHQLKHGLGFSDFTIYEKSKAVGDVWLNGNETSTSSTLPTTIHSFSFHQHFNWKYRYANGPEMAEYLNDTIDKHDLRQHLHLSIQVVGAQWIDDKNTWRVEMKDLESGIMFNRYCTILISALGLTSVDTDAKGDEEQYFDASDSDASDVAIPAAETRVETSRLTGFLCSYIPFYQRGSRLSLQLHSSLPTPHTTTPQRPAHDTIDIIGSRDQTSLATYWKECRNPQAYWGSLVASFPNFAIILGPHCLTANTSPFTSIENSVTYISRTLITPILDSRATRVEVRQAVEDRWTRSLPSTPNTNNDVMTYPASALTFYLHALLYGSRGLVYKNGQTGWWVNMFVRWVRAIRVRTWVVLLVGLAALRVKSVRGRVEAARRDVERYVPYEKRVVEVAGRVWEGAVGKASGG